MSLAPIEEAVAAVQRGEMVVVIDDADRENEGDLIMAAEKVTPEAIAFMVRHTSGVICAPLTGERLDALEIGLITEIAANPRRRCLELIADIEQQSWIDFELQLSVTSRSELSQNRFQIVKRR